MTDDRDPYLQTLFAEDLPQLDGEKFINDVIQRSERVRQNLYKAIAALVSCFIALAFLMQWPVLGIAITISEILGAELINLGNNTVRWLLLPVNNLATILVIIWRLAIWSWNRAVSGQYTN